MIIKSYVFYSGVKTYRLHRSSMLHFCGGRAEQGESLKSEKHIEWTKFVEGEEQEHELGVLVATLGTFEATA